MKSTLILFTGLFFLTFTSCSNSNPPADNPDPIDKTPFKVTWAELRSGNLKEGQVVILDGYIGALSDENFTSTNLEYMLILERRNQAHPFQVRAAFEYGDDKNQLQMPDENYLHWDIRHNSTPEEYYHSDIGITSNTGGTVVVGAHVQITGTYSPGSKGKYCNIKPTKIDFLDFYYDFDETVLETAVELTDEKVKQHTDETSYYYMDVVMSFSQVADGSKHKKTIVVESLSNNTVNTLFCQTGFWRGTLNDDPEYGLFINGLNGEIIEGDTARIYGTISSSNSSHFVVEEVNRLSLSFYELSQITIRPEHVDDEFISGCIQAINDEDGEALEYDYRDEITAERATILMTYWKPEQPWRMKDNFLAVLIDQDRSIILPLAEHCLDSPNDMRAEALCIMMDNWEQFEVWLDGHWDDVDPAIKAYKDSH